MNTELTRGQRRRMKKLAKFADRATEADRPTLAVPQSTQRTSRRTTSRAALVRPNKENRKCQRMKRKSNR